MIVEWKNSAKQNKIGQLTIKNYTFERAENIQVLHLMQITITKWIYKKELKKANKTYFML